ncbi:molybdopterin cofactor-binding domain-containing protein [Methylobacterium platani]|uniref:Aldehyde dehydrogenase n=2 Tax=Methylobacterium platani TaxID=427683 RepID=A0A179RXS4_9HYPH|nr:molybdopterin cofactor-binding domain-containing protein [Methylobacterium platani]KMO22126.1 aldehyde dehydrogenase [Methylobacterium platani JCM 14648]OAS15189.1 aldehyde dehydrogenase [Methylobacterium platani]
MTENRPDPAMRRRHWQEADDLLLVYRETMGRPPRLGDPPGAAAAAGPQRALYLAVDGAGRVTAFNGHVDLGTGIRTALAQIVAEELDVPFAHVAMELGSTATAPDQGGTIASETIQIAAIPLRQAAATARRHLVEAASLRLNRGTAELTVADGTVRVAAEPELGIPYGELVRGSRTALTLDPGAPLKPVEAYTVVGRPVPRVDIPEKAVGAWTYVHDVRVPGMVHGRVVRPPGAGVDAGLGDRLAAVDEASVAHIPGLVAVVRIGDFVGVVAEREENAAEAARCLRTTWHPLDGLPDLNRPEAALRGNPSTARTLLDRGDVDRALAHAPARLDRTYVWPYQMHGSIGPSCAVAEFRDGDLVVWSGTQNPHVLQSDLALLLDLPEDRIAIERHEAAGCYGRNCADDVAADAALLARAVGRPVRVQLTREQEHAWEPKGAAQVMDVRGGLDAEGGPAAYDFETRYPSNGAPTLALILTGKVSGPPATYPMGDRTAVPPYAFGHARVTVHDMPPIARASWLRGVSALPNTFAHESYIDELATAAGVDPIEYRLRYLDDPRAADLVRAVAERAAWVPHTAPGTHGGAGDILYGRGFAYAVYVHGPFPGKAAAWAAWVADVAVNRVTGEVAVTRVVVGQDSGLMINPDGVRHQIHGNVIQSTSRVLKESVGFDATGVTSREWGSYPILAFPQVPEIDVLLVPRPNEPPLGAGESASVPSAAAITNALFDATGIRFRELPLTAESVRAALDPPRIAGPDAPPRRRRGFLAGLFGAGTGALALGLTLLPWRPAYPSIERPDPAAYSAATIAQGRLVAAAGACLVCHAGPDGRSFAGGRGIETPFGTVYASNITPDMQAGIGAWSYPAFARAMREGVSRDGHHLYPAHPYTSFVNAAERDLQALYAFLMAQDPVAAPAPETKLRFPFGARPLMADWNALFHRPAAFADPARGPDWNRGAYLVEALGHCGACHSPRNALGAERRGAAHLAGGFADGWEAPALTGLSRSPLPWTEDDLYAYLRTGRSPRHGSAAGPMADVVASLAPLPDGDIRAMAVYLASLTGSGPAAAPVAVAATALPASSLFQGACASCHEGGAGGDLVPLGLVTSVHSAHPDNLIQAVLNGVRAAAERFPAPDPSAPPAAMPAFRDTLTDGQIAEVVAYARARYAPGAPAWTGLEAAVARVRGLTPHAGW